GEPTEVKLEDIETLEEDEAVPEATEQPQEDIAPKSSVEQPSFAPSLATHDDVAAKIVNENTASTNLLEVSPKPVASLSGDDGAIDPTPKPLRVTDAEQISQTSEPVANSGPQSNQMHSSVDERVV